MNRLKRHIIFIVLMACNIGNALSQRKNNMVLANDHLVLLIDLRSSKAQVDSILKAAGITGAKADMVFKGDYSALRKDGWNIVKLQDNLLQFDLSLKNLSSTAVSPFQITTKLVKNEGRPGYPDEVLFGLNSFSKVSVHELPSGLTRFFVPGNQKAKRVLLSGSFNDWSTGKGIMLRTDSGWISDVKLEPGVYAYKFIINGNWTTDTNNKLTQDDGVGNTNSIYFRYNYTFKLPGYANAKNVNIAGNFNNWNINQIALRQTFNGWERQMYLHDGIYAYRFMVDGQWIVDPQNPLTNKDASGSVKSVLNLGDVVNFKLNGFTNAKQVTVAGSFNNWNPNELYMQKNTTGWAFPYTLAAGNYQYKFIVDGRWITDPANQNTASLNGQTNSCVSVKANHTFTLKGFNRARTVRLAGNFNDWAEDGYTLTHQGDTWTISLRLKPGKCLYKFIVDGEWVLDNTNKTWEQNEFNTGNSVVWIE